MMKRWGKGGFEFLAGWVELSFVVLLLGGFALGKFVVDATFAYLVFAAAGIIAGRLLYVHGQDDPWPFGLISAAFVIGYLLGHRVGSGFILTAIFTGAAFASHWLHKHLNFLA